MSNNSNIKVGDIEYYNGTIRFPSVTNFSNAKEVLSFFMQSVLDGHVPTTKIIGFLANASSADKSISAGKFVTTGCTLESVPEIANRLSRHIIKGWNEDNGRIYKISAPMSSTQGTAEPILVTTDSPLKGPGSTGCEFVTKGVPLFNATSDRVSLTVIVSTNVGFNDMDMTSRVSLDKAGDSVINGIRNSDEFFFMNVYHSLNDYVRILPPTQINDICRDGCLSIGVRFLHGMTPSMFIEHWKRMFTEKCSEAWVNENIGKKGWSI